MKFVGYSLNIILQDNDVGVLMECVIVYEDLLEFGEKFAVKIILEETHFIFKINEKDYYQLEHQYECFAHDLLVIAQGCKIDRIHGL